MKSSTTSAEASAAAAAATEPRPLTAADFTTPAEEKNGLKPHRGMPAAKYIQNVEEFVGEQNPAHVEAVAHELLMKYRCMEQALQREYDRVGGKIIEMKESLDAVLLLQKKRKANAEAGATGGGGELKLYFELADTLHTEAVIPPTETVWLWLGANVVMEYSLDEAETLLKDNIARARKLHESTKEDMQWLRVQITVAEVTVARVHNFGVSWRKKKQQQEEALRTSKHKR